MAVVTVPLATPHAAVASPNPLVVTDPDILAGICEDAAAMRGDGAIGLLVPRCEAELSRWLRDNPHARVIVQGALTSLTGGATPNGDVVVSTRHFSGIRVHPSKRFATVGAGVVLNQLHEALAEHGLEFPPAPTHDGATIGGNAATNAAGAATFKYGTTRDWVVGLRIVLRNGDTIGIRRGDITVAHGDRIEFAGLEPICVRVPSYSSPSIKKSSAGYFVRSPMDLVDLFLGSEGTLGIITEVDILVVPRMAVVSGIAFFDSATNAVACAAELRRRSMLTRQGSRPNGLDVRSIEFFDRHCLELLREENKAGSLNPSFALQAAACLLFEQEVAPGLSYDATVGLMAGEGASCNSLADLMDLLRDFGVDGTCELALPDRTAQRKQMHALREAIPLAINEFVRRMKRAHPEIHKAAGDMIVPFDRFETMLSRYYNAFQRRGVRVVVFGHISDGNVHPNALPTEPSQMQAAEEALLELAAFAKQLGGCPLSEHGVGKHPLKKKMLADFWGGKVIDEMKALKRGFDPGWTLACGVLFDAS